MPQDSFIRNARRAALLILLLAGCVCVVWAQPDPNAHYRRVADSAFALLASYEFLKSELAEGSGPNDPLAERTVHPAQLTDGCAVKLIPEIVTRRNHASVGLSEIGNVRRQTRPAVVRAYSIKMNCLLRPIGKGRIVVDEQGGLFLIPSAVLQHSVLPLQTRQFAFQASLGDDRITSLEPRFFARALISYAQSAEGSVFRGGDVGFALQHLAYGTTGKRSPEIFGLVVPRSYFVIAATFLLSLLAFWMHLNNTRISTRTGDEFWIILHAESRLERVGRVALAVGLGGSWVVIALFWLTDHSGFDLLHGLLANVWNGFGVEEFPAPLMVGAFLSPVAVLAAGALMIMSFGHLEDLAE